MPEVPRIERLDHILLSFGIVHALEKVGERWLTVRLAGTHGSWLMTPPKYACACMAELSHESWIQQLLLASLCSAQGEAKARF